MPSVGHVAVGLATARIEKRPGAMPMNAWRVILILPVAPIGAALFSARGLEVMLTETVQFLPFFILGLWPRRAD